MDLTLTNNKSVWRKRHLISRWKLNLVNLEFPSLDQAGPSCTIVNFQPGEGAGKRFQYASVLPEFVIDPDTRVGFNAVSQAVDASSSSNHRKKIVASIAAINCIATKAAIFSGLIPVNVSENPRAMVTAGLAKEVDEVNQ